MSVRKDTVPPLKKPSINDFKKSLDIFKYIYPYTGYFSIAMIFLVLGSLIFMALMGLPGEMTKVADGGQPKSGAKAASLRQSAVRGG